MRTLRDIRKRIRTVRNIQEITRTMDMVSAAKLRKAQSQLYKLRPYFQAMREIVEDTVSEDSVGLHPFLERREVRNRCLVVVSSDKGLCGAYNANVIRLAEEFAASHDHVGLVTVGKKADGYFRRRGYRILRKHIGFGGSFDVGLLSPVASELIEDYLKREVDEVHIAYTAFAGVTKRNVVVEKLLGIEPRRERDASRYIFEPGMKEFLDGFLPRYVTGRFLMAMAEAFTSEHAGRMVSMKAATDNAEEMVKTLTLQLNRARQTAITRELADIVGGVEALK